MFSLRSIVSARKPQSQSSGIRQMSVDSAVDAFLVTLDQQSHIDFEAAYEAIAYARQHGINNPSRIWNLYHDAVFAAFVD